MTLLLVDENSFDEDGTKSLSFLIYIFTTNLKAQSEEKLGVAQMFSAIISHLALWIICCKHQWKQDGAEAWDWFGSSTRAQDAAYSANTIR